WFESIQVEAAPSAETFLQLPGTSKSISLIFHVVEFPFLSKVEYSGSRLLSQKQIEKMLEDKKLAPGLGKPADPAALQRIAFAIRTGLNELGHPEARIGGAQVTQFKESSRRWFPWPQESALAGLSVSIPVEAGPFYRFESIAATDALRQAAKGSGRLPVNLLDLDKGTAFSQQ